MRESQRVKGLRSKLSPKEVNTKTLGVRALGSKVRGLVFRVEDLGFRVSGLGFGSPRLIPKL